MLFIDWWPTSWQYCWCTTIDCRLRRPSSSRRMRQESRMSPCAWRMGWCQCRRQAPVPAYISKPGYYYFTLFLFRYIIRIMTLLFTIMTLLYHLFFCKCPDYYFSLFHYPKKDYYFTYDTSIISLIFININYCYYCYYHTIIWLIFTSNYYDYYPFQSLLLHLFLSVYIILIIAIITLLFALCVYHAIITIIFFETYYFNYLFLSENVSIIAIIPIITLLFALYLCLTIITIITFNVYYTY